MRACGALGGNILCAGMWFLTAFDRYSKPRAPFVDAFRMGFKDLVARIACICMGFKGYHLKTHANSSITICKAHKTHANSIKI